jgi:hypothetical protein
MYKQMTNCCDVTSRKETVIRPPRQYVTVMTRLVVPILPATCYSTCTRMFCSHCGHSSTDDSEARSYVANQMWEV